VREVLAVWDGIALERLPAHHEVVVLLVAALSVRALVIAQTLARRHRRLCGRVVGRRQGINTSR